MNFSPGPVPYADALTPETVATLARLPLQHLARKGDLKRVAFTDGLAMVSLDAPLVLDLRLKNAQRHDEARLALLRRSIARRGYAGDTPIVCRIGQKGKWVVIDGGHRLTAVRQLQEGRLWYRLARRAWRLGRNVPWLAPAVRWLFGEPDRLYCILFLGPRSNRLKRGKKGKRGAAPQP
jgi:hypothetical protein